MATILFETWHLPQLKAKLQLYRFAVTFARKRTEVLTAHKKVPLNYNKSLLYFLLILVHFF